MPRIVRCSVIQASNALPATEPLAAQKQAMIEKHLPLIRKAASDGAKPFAPIAVTMKLPCSALPETMRYLICVLALPKPSGSAEEWLRKKRAG